MERVDSSAKELSEMLGLSLQTIPRSHFLYQNIVGHEDPYGIVLRHSQKTV